MSECRNCGAPLSPAAAACLYCNAPGPAAGPTPGGAGAAWGGGAAIEVQAVGPNKIAVIKAVCQHALGRPGLKEAKDLVERPPPVRVAVEPSRAQAALEALVQAGARARLLR